MRLAAAVIVMILGLAASAEAAPSFDCAKAATPAEKAICASPKLSALYRDIQSAYGHFRRELKSVLDDSGVLEEQTEFLKRRDACATDMACLESLMAIRVSELLIRRDKRVDNPLEAFVGRYKGEFGWAIVRDTPTGYELDVSGAEPTSAKWICDVSSPIKEGVKDGVATADVGDQPGDEIVYLEMRGGSLELSEDADHRLAGKSCGANGQVDGRYRPVKTLGLE